jgi:hypothetical protein
METLMIVMMVLVCFSFVLKQTFHGVKEVMVMAVLLTFFVGMAWTFAIEQSKTQIAAWMADSQLMLDMAVLMSVDVSLTIFFCVMHVDIKTAEKVSKLKFYTYIFLKYFPGLLIFPVLFASLVSLIFFFPGASFQLIAWGLAMAVFVLMPSLTYGLRWLLPERPIRLELLFLVDVLLGLMGVVGTVNGQTAVEGISEVDVKALVAVFVMVLVGMAVGYVYYRVRTKKLKI